MSLARVLHGSATGAFFNLCKTFLQEFEVQNLIRMKKTLSIFTFTGETNVLLTVSGMGE